MQFAFLAFLLGHSLQAFGQWKALLHLALACEEAPLQTRPRFYADLLATVRAQLDHCLAAGRCAHAPACQLQCCQEVLPSTFSPQWLMYKAQIVVLSYLHFYLLKRESCSAMLDGFFAVHSLFFGSCWAAGLLLSFFHFW